ncbi:DUF3426 domain-containing protein [Agrobacterium vaccinii]|uniref:DUF3426 domain-containing protein n=1 Tax=Agrobacterium vaccinii TaxID=2735528 RepID=UPI001E51542C|nr:DUF3426 domain-containing protein [Agrobacterium vaccinii]UHS64276.1 DUF3426 domain-containing protein [Agrobacterium vaccinii]
MFRSSRRHATPDLDLLMPEAPLRQTWRTRNGDDILDAEFVTIKETPFRDYGNDNRHDAFQQPRSRPVSALAALRSLIDWVDRKLSGLSVDGYSAIVAAAVVGVFFISGGFTMLLHQNTANAVPVDPLVITHISVTPQDAGGMDVLVINGIVENNGNEPQAVPAIRADLFAAKGEKVASMLIEPPVAEMQPGVSRGFSAKLRHPGGKTPDIKLSFAGAGVSQR